MNEDLLNVMGNFVETELDYIENCEKEKFELQQERNNYKELYEKEKEKREALKHILIGKFNSTQDTIYLDILTDIMQPLEKGNENDK